MTQTDDAITSARSTLARVREEALPVVRRPARKRGNTARFRLLAIAVVNAIILLAAGIVGFVMPIGLFGALAVLLLMVAATAAIALAPVERPVSLEKLREAPVATLPAQTARWLEAQRPALPAPAVTLADQIGAKLAALSPQLSSLDDTAPVAAEIRKLVGEQLPDFIRGYTAVPAGLRTVPRNGSTPDAQLLDGLKVIDGQLGEMSTQLAQGDLDNLSTRSRYLAIRYQGDDT